SPPPPPPPQPPPPPFPPPCVALRHEWEPRGPRFLGGVDMLGERDCGHLVSRYPLNNGGEFMAPEPDDDDDETWVRVNAMNGNLAEMSPEAAGIAACLMTY
ncbi:antirestriction protein, partial [Escherichia coli]|uniref:antirestriction protein n=1 Tax=Escherichia coli TaxID=562 RepID=UPI001485B3D8